MNKRVCISGYYGFDNFGDEAILKTLVENLKNFEKELNITVFSSNPPKTAKELNVNSVHSFCPKDIVKSLFNCNYLISGGGSLLQDTTSAKSLIYYLGIIALAQILGKKTIIFAQGIGPIKNKHLEKLTAFILKKSKYISVRDDKSINWLKTWGIDATKCYDPVWNIETPLVEKTNIVGIQLRAFPTMTEDILNQLANLINNYYLDREIHLLSLQNKLDLEICNKLKNKLKSKNIKVIENSSNKKIIEDLSKLDILIAMRFHACLIGIKSGVKLLPINYDIKVEQLAKEFDLNCFNLEYIELNEIIFEQFTKNKIEYNTEKINSLMYDFKQLEEIIS